MPANINYSRHIALVFLILVSAFAIARSWEFGQAVGGLDHYQFWVVGEAVDHDEVSNPYADAERARMVALYLDRATHGGGSERQIALANNRAVLETYSTPFLYTAMHWLAGGDYETDLARWHAVSLACFVLGVVGICLLLGYSWIATLVVLSALLLYFAPFQSETQVANVNSVQLGGLALVLLLCQRSHRSGESAKYQIGAGALLGCLAMFKPNIVLVVLLVLAALMLQRKTQTFLYQCAGLLIGVGFAFASSSLFFGTASCWLNWMQTIQLIPPEIITPQMGNYSPLLFIAGAGSAGASPALALGLCLPPLAALWVRRHEAKAGGEIPFQRTATLIGIGCVAFVLSANLVWEHYFILTIPLLLSCLRPGIQRIPEDARQWIIERVLPGLALVALMATPTQSLSPLPHETYFPIVQGLGTLILYGLALHQLFLGGLHQEDHEDHERSAA